MHPSKARVHCDLHPLRLAEDQPGGGSILASDSSLWLPGEASILV